LINKLALIIFSLLASYGVLAENPEDAAVKLIKSFETIEGSGFTPKKVGDLKTLSEFENTEKFESYWKGHQKECFDYLGTGRASKYCHIGSEVWDRELNIYYKKLRSVLYGPELDNLKVSQLDWIKSRDKLIALIKPLTSEKYKDQGGTLYYAVTGSNNDRLITPIIKERALILKMLFEEADKIRNKDKYINLQLDEYLFKIVNGASPEVRRAAAYHLMSMYGADGNRSDINFINKNIDKLLNALTDKAVGRALTDFLILSNLAYSNYEDGQYLLMASNEIQKKAIEKFYLNMIDEESEYYLKKDSAEALIALNACAYKISILKFKEEFKEKPLIKYINTKRLNCN